MKIRFSILHLLALTQLFVILSLSDSYKDSLDDSSSSIFTYSRVAETENHCSSYLSLASKLSPDPNRGDRIKKELSFTYGDWDQLEEGGLPLMPFNGSDLLWLSLFHTVPLKLVSFQVMDINSIHHFENAVSLGGIMSIGIARNASYFDTFQSSPNFHMRPGSSTLKIAFEGVYLETSDESGKEHVMCLLGNTTLPISGYFNYDWNSLNSHLAGYSLLQDDQILLVLRYPQTFNLTKRAIRGEVRSLNVQASVKYFNNVYISSQMNHHSNYQFSSELKERTCDLHPYHEELTEYGANAFNDSNFCSFLQRISDQPFDVLQNYKFNDGDAPQSKLGPFRPGKETSPAWNYENLMLVFQHLICEEETANNNVKTARVSAVLRAFPASVPADTAKARTGLSALTLSVEGTWDSSSGKLCMIGCLGVVDSGLDSKGCNYQISLYFPSVFSIKQRSVILGSISRITNETDMFFPLLFDSLRRPAYLKSLGLHNTPYYNYSKVELAAEIKKRNQPSKFLSLIKKLFLNYPALVDGQDVHAQLKLLSNNLNVHAYAIRHQSSSSHKSRVYMQMEVLALGTLYEDTTTELEKKSLINNQLLKLSTHLTFAEGHMIEEYEDLYPFFLEGVYDSLAGVMHLIGCRKVSKFRTSDEHGLDCLVEVKVQYTSETIRWLKNPSVEMTITSQRREDDPLHFKPLYLKTSMIPYGRHQQDVAFRKLFEAVLRFLISLMVVGITYSQLLYMNANDQECTPYVSLVMLSFLILGYGAELIRATEILFESKESASYRKWPYVLDHHEYQPLMETIESLTRLLVLVTLLLSAWQYLKVSQARSKPNAYGPNKPKRLPRSNNVFQRNLKIQVGFSLVYIGLRMMELVLKRGLYLMDAFDLLGVLMRDVQMQIMRCQDLFLIAQIYENSLLETKVKPLRKTYYFGLTLLRLIIYLYDYIRDPVLDPFYDDGAIAIHQVESDLLTICVIMAAPIIMIIFASVVHIQQSWNYLKPRNRQSIFF